MTIPPNFRRRGLLAASQNEIFPRRCNDPGQLDLEVGNSVAVDIAADDRDVVRCARLIECLVAKLADVAVEVLRADELEGLVVLAGGVRVDAREIDLVLPRLEVRDDIVGEGPGPRIVN